MAVSECLTERPALRRRKERSLCHRWGVGFLVLILFREHCCNHPLLRQRSQMQFTLNYFPVKKKKKEMGKRIFMSKN